jgi:hypothetical protein
VALLNGKAVTSLILVQPPEAKTLYRRSGGVTGKRAASTRSQNLWSECGKVSKEAIRLRKNSANADFQVFA